MTKWWIIFIIYLLTSAKSWKNYILKFKILREKFRKKKTEILWAGGYPDPNMGNRIPRSELIKAWHETGFNTFTHSRSRELEPLDEDRTDKISDAYFKSDLRGKRWFVDLHPTVMISSLREFDKFPTAENSSNSVPLSLPLSNFFLVDTLIRAPSKDPWHCNTTLAYPFVCTFIH